MKHYKVGTEVRVSGDWGHGPRVVHAIVTSVINQNTLMARLGNKSPVRVHRGPKFFEYPSASARTVIATRTHGGSA